MKREDLITISGNELQIRFTGNDIKPSSISPKQLASLLVLLEEGIKPILIESYPEISEDDFIIGLQTIENKSISLEYIVKKHLKAVLVACSTFFSSISDGTLNELPQESIKIANKFSSFNKRYNCITEFKYKDKSSNEFKTYAKIDVVTKTKDFRFKQDEYLYGRLERITCDDDKSTLRVRLLNGKYVTAKVDTFDIKKYRDLLNEDVKLFGTSLFSGVSFKRLSFKMKSIVGQELYNINEAVKVINREIKECEE